MKRQDTIIVSARHFDKLMHLQIDSMYGEDRSFPSNEFEQGFIDQFGDFYTREEAMQKVLETGQPYDEQRNGDQAIELYSEGLY